MSKPLNKVKADWSPALAYAIGLIASDGNLSTDGRHINFTSKDLELAQLFKSSLGLVNKIGRKARGYSAEKKYFVVQFGDVIFYEFLYSIGLTRAKSKTIGKIKIPDEFFFDFLRGCIDGDGSIGVYSHPESQFGQLRVRLFSASFPFLEWIHQTIRRRLSLDEGWIERQRGGVYTLITGKVASIKILNAIYYPRVEYYLQRKYNIARPFLEN